MANIDGTIQNCNLLRVDDSNQDTTPVEWWEVRADFAAYDDSADVARILDVGAAITARARDGRTRTCAAAVPGPPGRDANGNITFFFADSGVAVDGSSDDLSGDLGGADHSGADRAAADSVGVIVYCTVA